MSKSLRERVAFATEKTDQCWFAPATIEQSGVRYSVRRLVYEWEVGPVPEGMFILASCRERYCVAPLHLWLSPWRAGNAKVGAKKKPPKAKPLKEPRTPLSQEEVRARMAEYKTKNADKIREWQKAYYLANRDALLQKARQYKQIRQRSYATEVLASPNSTEIKARRAANNREYKARLRNVPSEKILLGEVYNLSGGTCWLCNSPEITDDIWTVDHVIPISRGGPNLYSNVRLAHGRCNSRKRDRIVA